MNTPTPESTIVELLWYMWFNAEMSVADKRNTVVRMCKTEDEPNECESAATAETEVRNPTRT